MRFGTCKPVKARQYFYMTDRSEAILRLGVLLFYVLVIMLFAPNVYFNILVKFR